MPDQDAQDRAEPPELCPSTAAVYRDEPRLWPLIGPGGPFEVHDVEVGGVTVRDFVRAPRSIIDCFRMGAAHADLVNIVHGDERHTYGEVQERARRLARALRDTFDVGPGLSQAIGTPI